MMDVSKKNAEEKETLKLWRGWCDTPPVMVKKIDDTDFASVNPMYVIQRATEEFGPCGDGWGLKGINYSVCDAVQPIELVIDAVFWYRLGGEIKEIEIDTEKVYVSGTDMRKSLRTECIKKALSNLGLGADVYYGEHNGNNTLIPSSQPYQQPQTPQQVQNTEQPPQDQQQAPQEKRTLTVNMTEYVDLHNQFAGTADKDSLFLEIIKVWNLELDLEKRLMNAKPLLLAGTSQYAGAKKMLHDKKCTFDQICETNDILATDVEELLEAADHPYM